MQQSNNLNNSSFFIVVVLVVAISCLNLIANTNEALDVNKPSSRHNLFDPIYAFDDIDAHTVKVDNDNNQQPVAASTTRSTSSQTTTTTNRQQQQFGDKLLKTTPSILQNPTTINGERTSTTQFKSLPTEIQRNKKEIAGSSAQHRALILPTFGSSARLAESRSAKLINNNQEPDGTLQPSFRQQQQEQPAHWSALENYYQKLRLMSSVPKQQQQQQQPLPQTVDYQPIYQLLQQQEAEDSLSGFRQPVQTQNPPYLSTINNLNNNAYVMSVKSPSPFLLPISANQGSQSQSINSVNVGGLLPNVDTDYQSYSSPQKQYAPGVSRSTQLIGQQQPIIGAGSILQDRYTQEQIQLANNNQQQLRNQWYQSQLASGGRELILASPQGQQSVLNINNNNNQPILVNSGELDGRVRYLEWRKLPELLLIQQQQQRAKHQQETFGPWYDHQRSKELLLEEAYCGPRNYLNFNLATLTPATKSSARIQYSPLSKQLLQDNQSLDVPITLNAGEYPSHMGIYNGSRPNDDNFLCSATWIHEQYALTLASCFKNIRDPTKLVVRAGEWLLNLNTTNDKQKAMLIREIEQIHLFPKYRNDSLEHNLAIIKFTKPIEFLDTPYICPACQIQSRTSLKTSSCWAPVRNITLSEYFDAEGEGETKERKNVAMIEVPIKLIANDDNECYRQTRIEFFNFQHPNYICSADFRTSRWRARLNETEYFGSGIYCNEGGNLSLVSILHPIQSNSSSAFGYMDLSYYKPWMRNIISGRSF